MQYFTYGETEINYLGQKDAALKAAMDEIGHVNRRVIPDLFTALVNQIISQQISTKGAATIWNRLLTATGEITPDSIAATDTSVIQKCGTSTRKAVYIKELAQTILDGSLDLDELRNMPDGAVCERLSQIKGIGVWTAEMLMTFSMERPDIMSWDDIAIHRGLRMLYRHRRITKELFSKYKRRYSPYATVACLYLWAIADGQCAGLTDPAPMTEAQKKLRAKNRRKAADKRLADA